MYVVICDDYCIFKLSVLMATIIIIIIYIGWRIIHFQSSTL